VRVGPVGPRPDTHQYRKVRGGCSNQPRSNGYGVRLAFLPRTLVHHDGTSEGSRRRQAKQQSGGALPMCGALAGLWWWSGRRLREVRTWEVCSEG
jgi:hypothetical protein